VCGFPLKNSSHVRISAYDRVMTDWASAGRKVGGRNAAWAALALLAFGVSILLSDRLAAQRAVRGEHDRLINVARLTASSYQRQVDKFRLVATTLSSDSEVALLLDVRTADTALRLNERLADLSTTLDASVIYLLDDSGTTIASSNWQQADSFLGENYRFRDYFKQALAQGEWEQFALGTRSLVPGLFVARRVATGAGSRGVIVVKIRFDRLEREWASSAGPAFVADGQGVILVSSRPDWRFQTIRKLNDAEQTKLRAQVEFGKQPLVQNALFERQSVISNLHEFERDAAYVEAQEILPNGWSVHVLSLLGSALASARTFGRLVVLVIAGLIAALTAFYILRRRAIIAGEQRENAARIADLKDRLVQSNKLSALGQIAAGVGHEINQPLTAIGLRAQNAAKLMVTGRQAEAVTALKEISALTSRIGAITAELRRFSRRAERRMGRVSVQDVLAGTQLLLGDRIRSTGTTLAVTDLKDAIEVIGEQGRLEQVFVNLIQNAMDAMGDGGRIDLAITRAGELVTIRIADTGPGIAPDVRDKLFQPFTSTKDDGVGLGLVICRDIVAEFGGELTLAPAKQGAEFVITLEAAR
jgi:two-component system, NtrC family, C4-dicarboxylate transport sensor histidine kinase DctB